MPRPIVTPEYDQFIPYNSPDFLFIDWDLGNTCNFSCSYCASFVHDGSIPWVNIDKVDNLIEQIRDNLKNFVYIIYLVVNQQHIQNFHNLLKKLNQSILIQ